MCASVCVSVSQCESIQYLSRDLILICLTKNNFINRNLISVLTSAHDVGQHESHVVFVGLERKEVESDHCVVSPSDLCVLTVLGVWVTGWVVSHLKGILTFSR